MHLKLPNYVLKYAFEFLKIENRIKERNSIFKCLQLFLHLLPFWIRKMSSTSRTFFGPTQTTAVEVNSCKFVLHDRNRCDGIVLTSTFVSADELSVLTINSEFFRGKNRVLKFFFEFTRHLFIADLRSAHAYYMFVNEIIGNM